MLHYWSLQNLDMRGSWLTIGSFDGVHLGHQALLGEMVSGAHAEGLAAVVLTFHPHPAVVLNKRKSLTYLNSPEGKAGLLAGLGVDVVITHPFNLQVAKVSARDFIENLEQNLKIKRLCIGHDFALGRDRAGDLPALTELGKEFGFSINEVEAIKLDGEVVSSSRVRQALADGNVELAQRLMGRPYKLIGEVVHGDSRGKSLGFPTANMHVWSERALPKPGVYACRVIVEGENYSAVTNVGVRPTFENQPLLPQVEAYLLDFDGDLYRKTIHLSFIHRLRDEVRFNNVQALIEQMHQDVQVGRQYLARVE
jgi:riboflavin kinase / FMN adenylyltransferase